ncbi:MAG: hypothetical protein QOI74_3231 [Micromonosporaceae bacterium]|jgi:uncharacterized protein YcnI|nr:hypothetical protein [Micromonosporaceae bacterium]
MIRRWHAAALAIGAGVTGALAFAAPAAADVAVSPSSVAQGGSAELTFTIPEERPGAYTAKVELDAPVETPIAEIYPLSVDDWAPSTTTRTLDKPTELIHGTTSTEVVAAVTWIRMSPATGPAQPDVLTIALGPMPQADGVEFTLVQTYSDGTVVHWADPIGGAHPAPFVSLAGEAPAAAAHGHDAPGGTAPVAAGSDTGGRSTAYGILVAGLLVGLVAGLGLDGWIILRAVRRSLAGTSRTRAAASPK